MWRVRYALLGAIGSFQQLTANVRSRTQIASQYCIMLQGNVKNARMQRDIPAVSSYSLTSLKGRYIIATSSL